MVREGKAYAYAQFCVNDSSGYVPKYVKLQCESWIKIADGEDADAFVDENANTDKTGKNIKNGKEIP